MCTIIQHTACDVQARHMQQVSTWSGNHELMHALRLHQPLQSRAACVSCLISCFAHTLCAAAAPFVAQLLRVLQAGQGTNQLYAAVFSCMPQGARTLQ